MHAPEHSLGFGAHRNDMQGSGLLILRYQKTERTILRTGPTPPIEILQALGLFRKRLPDTPGRHLNIRVRYIDISDISTRFRICP